MNALELTCLAIVACWLAVCLRLGDRRLRAERFLILAVLSWLGEDVTVRAYGFYHYASAAWTVWLDQVPLLIALIWPVVILSAWDLARALSPTRSSHAVLTALLVLADATLIEPIAVRAGLWSWTRPGLFNVPPLGIVGWAFHAGLCVATLEARHVARWALAPVGLHVLLLASWWGAFRWFDGALPELALLPVAAAVSAALTWRAVRGDVHVPLPLLLARLPAALFFFALLARHATGATTLIAWAVCFAPPYLALMWTRPRVAVALALLLHPSLASAHSLGLSKSVWTVRSDAGAVEATLGFHDSDMEAATGLQEAELPADADARRDVAQKHVLSELCRATPLRADSTPCTCQPLEVRRGKGPEARLRWSCPTPLGELELRLEWMRVMPPGHRHVATFTVNGQEEVKAFTRSQTAWVRQFAGAPPTATAPLPDAAPAAEHAEAPTVLGFIGLGVHHIATGWDHLLFLMLMLLVGGSFKHVLGVVTAFTLAHSVTLSIGWFGLVPDGIAGIVEPAIALSIVAVAVENVVWPTPRHRWVVAFAFGLVHGLGFAGAIADVPIPKDDLVASLLGFNLGVELGQLVVVALVTPVLHRIATRPWFKSRVLVPGSIAGGVAGCVLLVQRVMGG